MQDAFLSKPHPDLTHSVNPKVTGTLASNLSRGGPFWVWEKNLLATFFSISSISSYNEIGAEDKGQRSSSRRLGLLMVRTKEAEHILRSFYEKKKMNPCGLLEDTHTIFCHGQGWELWQAAVEACFRF